jgi:hypothetical protein
MGCRWSSGMSSVKWQTKRNKYKMMFSFCIWKCTWKLKKAFFVWFFFLMCRNGIGAPQKQCSSKTHLQMYVWVIIRKSPDCYCYNWLGERKWEGRPRPHLHKPIAFYYVTLHCEHALFLHQCSFDFLFHFVCDGWQNRATWNTWNALWGF